MNSRFLPIRKLFTSQSSTFRKLILVHLDVKEEIEVARALANRIQSELRASHLNVSQTNELIESSQVPYTIVITDQTISDGVLKLKHYQPRITEEVHVSNLKDRLLPRVTQIF